MKLKQHSKQSGFSLIELMAALAIGALVTIGGLALYNSTSTSQASTQLSTDLVAIKSAVKQLAAGQGGYGTGSLNSPLIIGNKIPGTMSISGTTISHSLNGTVVITGNTTNFTIAVSNIPTDVCLNIVSGATGYTSIQVGANAARTTLPVNMTNAATDCSAAATQTITYTAS